MPGAPSTSTKATTATFDDRPSKLFDGMHHARLAILLASVAHRLQGQAALFVTGYNKWSKEERAHLFHKLRFVPVQPTLLCGIFPKVGSQLEVDIVTKVLAARNLLGRSVNQTPTRHHATSTPQTIGPSQFQSRSWGRIWTNWRCICASDLTGQAP